MDLEIARIKVWQCVGCGRIDDPRPCVGICRDEKRTYVPAEDHDAVIAALEGEVAALRRIVREIAGVTPRAGEFESTYRALQRRARGTLEAFAPR
jgi:hypothetical protein